MEFSGLQGSNKEGGWSGIKKNALRSHWLAHDLKRDNKQPTCPQLEQIGEEAWTKVQQNGHNDLCTMKAHQLNPGQPGYDEELLPGARLYSPQVRTVAGPVMALAVQTV
jgi:hypothetical protein